MNPKTSLRLASVGIATLLLSVHSPAQGPTLHGVAFHPVKSRSALARRKAMLARSWTDPSVRVDSGDGHATTIKGTNRPAFTDDRAHFAATKQQKGSSTPSATLPTWVTSTYNETFTAQSTSFLSNDYASNAVRIVPGAIYPYEDFFRGSLPRELGARNPMAMDVGGANEPDSDGNVQDPTFSNCDHARKALVGGFKGSPANVETSYQVVESNNSADLNLQLSGGASAFGFSFSDAFQHQSSENTVCLTIDARKVLYTVGVETPEGGFFKDSGVEQTPNLVVVGQVAYGARVLANYNLTFKSVKDANDFKASYSGLTFNADAAFSYVQSHQSTVSTINGYIVGGPSDRTKVSFSKKGLESAINGVLTRVGYANAQPVEYKLYDMAGDLVGVESATDTFTIVQAVPSGKAARLTNARVRFDTGGDDKDDDSKLVVYVYPGTTQGNGRNGALMAYEQRGNDKFAENTTRYVYLQTAPIDATTFVRSNGGHVHLDLFRNGHDTWVVNHMAIVLDFEDGSTKTVDIPGFTTKQGDGALDWYFNPDFSLKQGQ